MSIRQFRPMTAATRFRSVSGRASPAPLSRSIQSPCRWIGWFIMVSFLRTSRTVSPSVKCISGVSEYFRSSNDQMNFSMLPVSRISTVRSGGLSA